VETQGETQGAIMVAGTHQVATLATARGDKQTLGIMIVGVGMAAEGDAGREEEDDRIRKDAARSSK